MKLHRDLGIAQREAWYLAHRIREAWYRETHPMAGPVEADETLIGGKARNMHRNEKPKFWRGPVGKATVVGLKDRATNEVRAQVVSRPDAENLRALVNAHIDPEAELFTDDSLIYRGMPNHEMNQSIIVPMSMSEDW